ncbi:unnamed protein product [Rhizophagus irregularis]|nr:unnamed protein product [Rhizophagus irregularis]
MTSTSLRVALRVRPLNNKEILQNCSECLTIIPDAPQILIGTDKSFTFDYVFPSDTEQEVVFQDCVSSLVDKFVEGYNVTILAYGQTGSGKTYSMGTALTGSNIPPEHQGIVPRATRKLFSDLHERKEKNPSYQFEVYVSFLKLYNEDLIDLLDPQSRENNKKGKSDLMIREDANGQIYWVGVKEVQVSDPDELLGQLQRSSLCRTLDMNMVSSRSHTIFSVILKQSRAENLEESKENDASPAEYSTASKRKSKQKSLKSKVISKFHFVDLAGSERLKRTNVVGDRSKGIAINDGLLALGNVISALGDESRKVTHIPYRDSKLTRLLQDSLGGNSQTLMLACVSPADSNFMETLNTLKYANRARNIKHKISVNESYGGNSVEINQLRGQISRLKLENQTLRAGGCNEETNQLISGVKTHFTVQGYETEIKNLKDQISELLAGQASQYLRKSSLAGTPPGREKDYTEFFDPHIYSLDDAIHYLNNNDDNDNNKENAEKKGKKKEKRSSKESKTRADGHFLVSNETSTKISPIDDKENAEGDDESLEVGLFKLTRKLRRRSKTRDKLEKAKEQLRQGYVLIKSEGYLHVDPILSHLIKQPSSTKRTKSESYIDQMIRNHQKEQDCTDCSSQQEQTAIALTRMLHQVQADIAVKEQLVSQLERAEQEYTNMRAQYEQKLTDMREALITLQQERNATVKHVQNASTSVSTRDKNSILAELKTRYEHKMKHLIQEISELRRKYNEATQSNSRNRNEAILKSMRAQIEQLKSEKMRMMKLMEDEAKRVREMTERNQREIQNLRRKEKTAQNKRNVLKELMKCNKPCLKRNRKKFY